MLGCLQLGTAVVMVDLYSGCVHSSIRVCLANGPIDRMVSLSSHLCSLMRDSTAVYTQTQ